jgi:hypothetical protein
MSASKSLSISAREKAVLSFGECLKDVKNAMTALEQIETGSFATPTWVMFPPDSVRVVSWNINRGLHLDRVIQFLTGTKADFLLLQESDQNARRTLQIRDGPSSLMLQEKSLRSCR